MGQQAQTQARVFANTVRAEGRISPTMVFDFSAIDFSSRSAVYTFAIDMEDKTAETYNALILRATDPETVTFLAKIASVEARHAAALRDLSDIAAGNSDTPNRTSFAADSLIPPATGLEPMTSPEEYLALMLPYAKTSLTLKGA
jgi:rubrerythrin